MRLALGLMAAAILCGALPGHAQVYQLELDVRGAGAAAGQPAQHYAMVIDESRKGVFQAGSRVTASGQIVDVGTKIECAVHGSGDGVALNGSIEWSEINGTVTLGGNTEPIIGQRKMTFQKSVELGKPVVIVQDAKQQVEATVNLLQAP